METKDTVNFTIDKEILKQFKEETKKRDINKSSLIQRLMSNWLDETANGKRAYSIKND